FKYPCHIHALQSFPTRRSSDLETEGASEILLNSIDADGVKKGYDIALNTAVAEAVDIPVIASGGAGKIEDFQTVLQDTGVDAALAASVFHYDDINIATLKDT